MTNEVLDHEAEDWDQVVINGIPLLARTLEDATEWASFILQEQTPGYTTTERTERVLNDILEDDPFRLKIPIPYTRDDDATYCWQSIEKPALQNIFTLEMIWALPHLFRSSLSVVKEMNILLF